MRTSKVFALTDAQRRKVVDPYWHNSNHLTDQEEALFRISQHLTFSGDEIKDGISNLDDTLDKKDVPSTPSSCS